MKRRTVPHQGLVARIGAAGVASVSRAPRAMSGAIRRVRRKRKASSISEGPDGAMPPGQWRYLPVGEKF